MNICNKMKPLICKYLFFYLELEAWYLKIEVTEKPSSKSGFLQALLFAQRGWIPQYCIRFLGGELSALLAENYYGKCNK